jgi:hypothetical protein
MVDGWGRGGGPVVECQAYYFEDVEWLGAESLYRS